MPFVAATDVATGEALRCSQEWDADALLVCAAGQSPQPMSRASALCRDGAAAVITVNGVRVPVEDRPRRHRGPVVAGGPHDAAIPSGQPLLRSHSGHTIPCGHRIYSR